MTDITARAQELLAGRIDAIRTLSEQQTMAEEARETADAADHAATSAWTAATAAGWTASELRKLGLNQPATRSGGRPKGSRNKLPAGARKGARENTGAEEGQS